MNEQTYQMALKMGLIPSLEEDVDYWRACLAQFNLHPPKEMNWQYLAKELRLISLEEAERPSEVALGNSDLSKQVRKIASDLKTAFDRLAAAQVNTATFMATKALQEKGWSEPSGSILFWANWAERLADELAKQQQRPRWRQKALRNSKIALACKLSELFEQCFDKKASPIGGSEPRKLEDTNEWTRFFQAVAFSFYGDRETNDRQAVLWEASRIVQKYKSYTLS